MVDPEYKCKLIQYLLLHHVPVSDWYPVIAPLFGNRDIFPNSQAMEREILNLPIDNRIDSSGILDICDRINRFWDEKCP